ncbi:Holliday junction resolvase RuvX [Candidatus Hepatincola sp. Pdp]
MIQEISLISIKQNIKKEQRLLAIDMSKKHLGLAISNPELSIAFPYKTIIRTKFLQDMKTLQEIIKKEQIFALIIGYPLNNIGKDNSRTQSVKDFTLDLQKVISIPCYFQDERFSTYAVQQQDIKNIKKNNDDQAAAWFLQIVLDKLQRL